MDFASTNSIRHLEYGFALEAALAAMATAMLETDLLGCNMVFKMLADPRLIKLATRIASLMTKMQASTWAAVLRG